MAPITETVSEHLRGLSLPPQLSAKGRPFSLAPDRLGRLTPTRNVYTLGLDEAWARFRADGYLFLKGILNREQILAFRQFYFDNLETLGVHGLVRTAEYQALCAAPEVVRFYEWFLGGAVHLHKRKLLRHSEPKAHMMTGAHYDLVYINQGTSRVYTSWIPLGDLPLSTGTLMYLEQSHLIEDYAELHKRFADGNPRGWITMDLPGLAELTGRRWLAADFEAGDMMVHGAYIIHAAPDADSAQGVSRLSTDIRYQLASEEIDPRWQNHWSADDGL